MPVTHITFPCEHSVVTLVITTSGRPQRRGGDGRARGGGRRHRQQGYVPASTHAVVQMRRPMLRIEGRRAPGGEAALPATCATCSRATRIACWRRCSNPRRATRFNPIEQRCLRWLLTLHDRIGSPVLRSRMSCWRRCSASSAPTSPVSCGSCRSRGRSRSAAAGSRFSTSQRMEGGLLRLSRPRAGPLRKWSWARSTERAGWNAGTSHFPLHGNRPGGRDQGRYVGSNEDQ